jgi:carbonic anhydrase
MKQLLEGIQSFRQRVYPRHSALFQQLSNAQHPQALFITCADSRVVPDLITQSLPGDLFICRTIGNLVPPNGDESGGVSAAIEYALEALNVPNIILCGHSDCGAMKAVLHPEKLNDLPSTRAWLRHADAARHVVRHNYRAVPSDDLLPLLIEENVITQLDHLKTHPAVAARLAKGTVQLFGLVYKIHSGEITAYDATSERFIPVENALAHATPRARLRLATQKEVA